VLATQPKGVSTSVFIIVVILVAIIAGVVGYFSAPAGVTQTITTGATATVTTTQTQTQTVTVSPTLPGTGLTIYWIGGGAGDPFDARLYKGSYRRS
jgi:hypothetical protein